MIPSRRQFSQAFERKRIVVVGWIVVLLSFGSSASQAIDWKRMVMPGELVRGHEKLEKECSSCHTAFDDDAQRSLCLTCHEPIADDLARAEGFHAMNPLAANGQCRSCHPDHRGRDADIRGLSQATFDHRQTDYPLLGQHEALACEQCHSTEVSRRETPSDCISCHRETDAHRGSLGEDCQKCHDESRWQSTRFEHNETKYPLTGAHETASCDGCHVAGGYAGTPTDCVSCHAIDDTHGGNFGARCADCHDTRAWRRSGFDHGKKSGFPLRDAHAKASCYTCHRKPPGERKLPESCSGCHARDDVHANRFGDQCGTCHSPSSWKEASFDHAEKAKFPLLGAHSKTACNSCHASRVTEEKSRAQNCNSCHQRDDVHQGNLGKDCSDCHNAESFSGGVRFDHELTRFPLLGLHAIAACEVCHVDQTFKQADLSCVSCHAAKDVHEKRLGSECAQCHNPNGWDVWRFDHDVRSKFQLHGAHSGLECTGCHRSPMTKTVRLAGDCVDCHSREDAHRGAFGRRCSDCHGETAWKPASFGRSGGLKK